MSKDLRKLIGKAEQKYIEETPELLEARPPIVVPHGGFYVVLGGNMVWN